MRIVVVGAGIGGLTAARALARTGHDVTVLEASRSPAPATAGLLLPPNAVACLRALGVDAAAFGRPVTRTIVTSASGRTLARSEAPADLGLSYGVTRSALQAALTDGLPRSVDVLYAAELTGLTLDGRRPLARWRGGVGSFDLVVGADGVGSTVRGLVHGPVELTSLGSTCWRGLAALSAEGVAHAGWRPGGRGRTPIRGGVLPVSASQVSYYLVADAEPGAPAPPWPDGFRALFAGLPDPIGALVAGLPGPPPLHDDLVELPRPVWGRGRVVLLGDAAHAMLADLDQGPAMVVEDAVALAHAAGGGPDAVLTAYTRLRAGRVRQIQRWSRRLGGPAHPRPPSPPAVAALLAAAGSPWAARRVRGLLEPGMALAKLAR